MFSGKRQFYDEPMQNPLPKLYHEKRDDSEKVRFAIPKAKGKTEDEESEIGRAHV